MSLFFIIIFSAIGMGYIVYGKKQENYIVLLTGILLCVYPYFFQKLIIVLIVGLLLMIIPFFIK